MSDGGQVAKRADNLLIMDRPITIDENGNMLPNPIIVWTGTNGITGVPSSTCQGWSVGDTSAYGEYGRTDVATQSDWIDHLYSLCDARGHLYCFEQPP
jgi:hypothetical protein